MKEQQEKNGSTIQKSAGACKRLRRIIEELRGIQKKTPFGFSFDDNIDKAIKLLEEYADEEDFYRQAYIDYGK